MLVDINLLPEKVKERSTLLITTLIILSAALLSWLLFWIFSNVLEDKTVAVQAQIDAVQQRQNGIREELTPTTLTTEKTQLLKTVEWVQHFQYETVPLLSALIYELPRRGFFRQFEFTAPNEAVVEIQFDQSEDAAYYMTSLKESPFVTSVTLESVLSEKMTEEISTTAILPRYVASYRITFVDERQEQEVETEADIEEEGIQ